MLSFRFSRRPATSGTPQNDGQRHTDFLPYEDIFNILKKVLDKRIKIPYLYFEKQSTL